MIGAMSTDRKKQFMMNSFSGLLVQIITAGVGAFLIPYMTKYLGDQGFGIYQMSYAVLMIVMFLNLGMGPAMVRFFSKSIAENNVSDLKKIASTGQLCLGGTGLVAALIIAGIAPFFANFYGIAPEFARDSALLLLCLSVVIFLNFETLVFRGCIVGNNRYDLVNAIDMITQLLRLGLIVVFFETGYASIVSVGMAMICSQLFQTSLIIFFSYVYVGKSIVFSLRNVNGQIFYEMFSIGFLSLISTISFAVSIQVPQLVIGKTLGPEMVAAFAPTILVANALAGFIIQLSCPLAPVASRDIAETGGKNLGRWVILLSQFISCIAGICILPFLVYSPEILALWLGPEKSWLAPHLAIIVFGVVYSQVQSVIYYLALGSKSIAPTTYSALAMAIAIVFGVFWGTYVGSWNLLDVVIFMTLIKMIRSIIYLPFAYTKQFNYGYMTFLNQVFLKPGVLLISVALLTWGIKIMLPNNLLFYIVGGICMLMIYCIACWVLLMNRKIKEYYFYAQEKKRVSF